MKLKLITRATLHLNRDELRLILAALDDVAGTTIVDQFPNANYRQMSSTIQDAMSAIPEEKR